LVAAKSYADEKDALTLASAQEYSDANLVAAKSYADDKDALTLASAQEYSDANLSIAQNYTDDQIEVAMNNMRDYADTRDALFLNQANAYTDKRIEKLDKDLSAGIASSAALSSVAVSGVKKGEVSFGAGFGHHNSQSAAAFGAVMGLSDGWSVNAGAGFSNSNVTVRAGTNYKFKLF
jgi:autotransporter adhesin